MVLALHWEGRTAAAEREPLGLAEGQKAGYCWWKSCCAGWLAGGGGAGRWKRAEVMIVLLALYWVIALHQRVASDRPAG